MKRIDRGEEQKVTRKLVEGSKNNRRVNINCDGSYYTLELKEALYISVQS